MIRAYDETEGSDSREKAIDLETGEFIGHPIKEKGVMDGMIMLYKWAEAEQGHKFVNRMKQMAAMKKMRIAGINPKQIKERWEELASDKFYSEKGFDFMTVCSSFDRKPPQ